jgi:DUF4097 and DUF4098 domain-containing protein YvlB
MTRKRMMLALLVAVSIVLPVLGSMKSQVGQELREELHKTYPLTTGGRVRLENTSGTVRIMAWDRDEVKIDCVKRAFMRERLQEAEIKIDATLDEISIKTRYPSSTTAGKSGPETTTTTTWNDGGSAQRDNPATVEYTVTVPRIARLDRVRLVNSSLDIEGLAGEVNAETVNGSLTARRLSGPAALSTVNGNVKASLARMGRAQVVSLSSVNGNVFVDVSPNASANIRANNARGAINTNFDFAVRRVELASELTGVLGSGEARVTLTNINGAIIIRRDSDAR